MSMQVLVPAVISIALLGSFAVAFMRFSKPARQLNGKARVEPQA